MNGWKAPFLRCLPDIYLAEAIVHTIYAPHAETVYCLLVFAIRSAPFHYPHWKWVSAESAGSIHSSQYSRQRIISTFSSILLFLRHKNNRNIYRVKCFRRQIQPNRFNNSFAFTSKAWNSWFASTSPNCSSNREGDISSKVSSGFRRTYSFFNNVSSNV